MVMKPKMKTIGNLIWTDWVCEVNLLMPLESILKLLILSTVRKLWLRKKVLVRQKIIHYEWGTKV